MALFDQWPYTNLHNLNLDWIVKILKDIKGKTDTIDDDVARAAASAAVALESKNTAIEKASDASNAALAAENFYEQTKVLTGAPLVASALSDMTDTDKVYVYTVDGHWYYWDGSAWTDGGLYQSRGIADGSIAGIKLSDDIKEALLSCFANVAWINNQGLSFYNELERVLYSGALITDITAVYTQTTPVTVATPLDDLKNDLVVTANYDDGTSREITNYTLSGTLSIGTSVITVTYATYTATFNVTVGAAYLWSLSSGSLHIGNGSADQDASNDIYISTNSNNLARRRYVYTSQGPKPYKESTDNVTFTVTDPPEYMVPVPDDATSVTYSITPNTQYMGLNVYTYDSVTNAYTKTNAIGWKQGSFTQSLTAGANQYVQITTKYDSAGTSYPVEPSDIVISFS